MLKYIKKQKLNKINIKPNSKILIKIKKKSSKEQIKAKKEFDNIINKIEFPITNLFS